MKRETICCAANQTKKIKKERKLYSAWNGSVRNGSFSSPMNFLTVRISLFQTKRYRKREHLHRITVKHCEVFL